MSGAEGVPPRRARDATVSAAPPEVATGWAAHPDALRAWARGEAASFVYARATVLPRTIGAEARELVRLGIAVTVSRKLPGGGFAFIVQRRGTARLRPVMRARPAAETPKVRALPAGDELGRAVLAIFTREANMGLRASTDASLARALDLRNADQASHIVRRIRAAGVIETSQESPAEQRIVTIAATGRRTAG